MIERIVLFAGDPRVPRKSRWVDTFSDCARVRITDERHADTDAMLVSVLWCEKFGCRAGSTDDTLGVMYVYDTWLYEPPNEYYPRIAISNAVWRHEPPIDIAVTSRLRILAATVEKINRDGPLTIRSLTIDCANLASWKDFPEDVHIDAIRTIRRQVGELFGC
jgi:hypothetical protein